MNEHPGLKAYAHVIDGKVVNTSIWDGVQEYTPPDGATMILLPTYTDDDGVERHIGGIGWTYDEQDGFRPSQPYPSWAWGGSEWVAPVAYPDEGYWKWDEDAGAWVE